MRAGWKKWTSFYRKNSCDAGGYDFLNFIWTWHAWLWNYFQHPFGFCPEHEPSIFMATSGDGIKAYSVFTSEMKTVVRSRQSIYGIAYDSGSDKIYWCGNSNVFRGNRDGGQVETVLETSECKLLKLITCTLHLSSERRSEMTDLLNCLYSNSRWKNCGTGIRLGSWEHLCRHFGSWRLRSGLWHEKESNPHLCNTPQRSRLACRNRLKFSWRVWIHVFAKFKIMCCQRYVKYQLICV